MRRVLSTKSTPSSPSNFSHHKPVELGKETDGTSTSGFYSDEDDDEALDKSSDDFDRSSSNDEMDRDEDDM